MKANLKQTTKEYAVMWINFGNDKVMYSGSMTKEEAERLRDTGHWHSKAYPAVIGPLKK
jgi:hypothetical protein